MRTADFRGFTLYTMLADGSQLTRIAKAAAEEGFLSWSPDGTHIAFVGDKKRQQRDLHGESEWRWVAALD